MINNQLLESIKKLQESVKDSPEELKRNEVVVRTSVNKILRGLGWDDANTKEVKKEWKTSKNGSADYILNYGDKDFLIIETKRLNEKEGLYEKHRDQLTNYLFDEDIEWGVLTNGRDWILLNSRKVGLGKKGSRGERKVIWKINFEEDTVEEILYKLKYLSKRKIGQLKKKVKNEELLKKAWLKIKNKELIDLIRKEVKRKSLDREHIKNFLELGPQIKKEDKNMSKECFEQKPKEIKIFGKKKSEEVKDYRDLLLKVVNILKIKKPVKRPLGGRSSASVRYIVNKEKKHGSGKPFTDAKQTQQGLYVEFAGLDAETIKKCVRELVHSKRKNENYLKIKYEIRTNKNKKD